ncbi:hypothetical protein CH063_13619, partial [Colletotrichum higginsianum]
MPSGFKLFSKGPKKGKSKENTLDPSEPAHPDETTEISLAATLTPLPDGDPISHIDELVRPHTSSGRPTTSSGASIKSAMPSFTTAPSTKQVMTPEKARLMKAMQLREKKKKMMNQQSATTPAVDAPAEQLMSEKAQPAQHVEEIAEHTLVAEADDGEEEEEEEDDDDDNEDDDRRLSESNEDNTDAEVDTHGTHDAVESATESGIAPAQAAEPASPVEAVAPTSAEPEAVDGEPQEEGESLAEGLAPAAVDDVPVVQFDATPEAVTAPEMSETQDTSTVEKEATLEVAEPVEQQQNETEK